MSASLVGSEMCIRDSGRSSRRKSDKGDGGTAAQGRSRSARQSDGAMPSDPPAALAVAGAEEAAGGGITAVSAAAVPVQAREAAEVEASRLQEGQGSQGLPDGSSQPPKASQELPEGSSEPKKDPAEGTTQQ
eukprot:5146811-Alexandrium_andersonii.AAC.1